MSWASRLRPASSQPVSQLYPLGSVPRVARQTIVRRDIRALSPEEQTRVCDAIEKMMEPGKIYQGFSVAGKGSSSGPREAVGRPNADPAAESESLQKRNVSHVCNIHYGLAWRDAVSVV